MSNNFILLLYCCVSEGIQPSTWEGSFNGGTYICPTTISFQMIELDMPLYALYSVHAKIICVSCICFHGVTKIWWILDFDPCLFYIWQKTWITAAKTISSTLKRGKTCETDRMFGNLLSFKRTTYIRTGNIKDSSNNTVLDLDLLIDYL